jgi:hypothetical protein
MNGKKARDTEPETTSTRPESVEWLQTFRGEKTASSGEGEYSDATMFSNRDEPAMGVRYDGEPLMGIRVMSEVVVFGYADDRGVTVTLEEETLKVRKDGEYLAFETHQWDAGELPIIADGIDTDLALISGSKEVNL